MGGELGMMVQNDTGDSTSEQPARQLSSNTQEATPRPDPFGCTHMTGTPRLRAFSTAAPIFLMMREASHAFCMTPTYMSTTKRTALLPSRTIAILSTSSRMRTYAVRRQLAITHFNTTSSGLLCAGRTRASDGDTGRPSGQLLDDCGPEWRG